MVGRLTIERAVGPGTLPFDYIKAEGHCWSQVPSAARRAFLCVGETLRRKVVGSPLAFSP
jgi:hypothetical protein